MDFKESRSGPKKRSKARRMVTEEITLITTERAGKGKKAGQSIGCVTTNVSDSGIGIYAEKSLASGSKFIVYSRKLWDLPREGVIKWCRKLAEGLYRAGIEVTGPSAGPRFSCGERHEDFGP
ncbi:MAG: hypothetical protein M0Z48_08400 [Nitrospiraceae bacterium]|nr:hypothetical protein [Nitrospiraceae bacterium]